MPQQGAISSIGPETGGYPFETEPKKPVSNFDPEVAGNNAMREDEARKGNEYQVNIPVLIESKPGATWLILRDANGNPKLLPKEMCNAIGGEGLIAIDRRREGDVLTCKSGYENIRVTTEEQEINPDQTLVHNVQEEVLRLKEGDTIHLPSPENETELRYLYFKTGDHRMIMIRSDVPMGEQNVNLNEVYAKAIEKGNSHFVAIELVKAYAEKHGFFKQETHIHSQNKVQEQPTKQTVTNLQGSTEQESNPPGIIIDIFGKDGINQPDPRVLETLRTEAKVWDDLSRQTTTIGRYRYNANWEVGKDNNTISRLHASITQTEQGVEISNLSKNQSVIVGTARIQSGMGDTITLQNLDIIQLGRTILKGESGEQTYVGAASFIYVNKTIDGQQIRRLIRVPHLDNTNIDRIAKSIESLRSGNDVSEKFEEDLTKRIIATAEMYEYTLTQPT